jgi:hypothetical protein
MPPRKTTTADAAASSTPIRRAQRVKDVGYVEALSRYSDLLYKGGLCPKSKQQAARPEFVAAIIEIGRDVGLPDTMALANISIMNGKPMIYGDAGLALIRASGLMEYIKESFSGDGEEFGCTVEIKRVGVELPRIQTYKVKDAVRAELWGREGPWTTNPRRMLRFRALSFACRDEFGDVLCGLNFVEADDAYEVHTIDTAAIEAKIGAIYAAASVAETVGQMSEATAETPSTLANTTTTPEPVVEVITSPAPEPTPEPAPEPTGPDESQAKELTFLRSTMLAAKGIDGGEEAKAAWAETLKPYGATSARDLPRSTINLVIADLRKLHDLPTSAA